MVSKVGMIGIGIMGGAFSGHLLKAGFTVTGYEPDAERLKAFTDAGGVAAASPADVVAASEITISSLPTMPALHDVAANIAANPSLYKDAGAIVMETSTMPVEDKQQAHDVLAAAGVTLLDCPVSGTGLQARNKDLGVYLSGDEDAATKCVPIVEAISKVHRYVGPFGHGSKMKYIANCLVAIHTAGAAEAMNMGVRGGLPADLIYDVITETSPAATSPMFNVRGKLMKDGSYPAQMPLYNWKKDTTVIGDFGKSVGATMPLFDAAVKLYDEARETHNEDDIAAIYTVYEKTNN